MKKKTVQSDPAKSHTSCGVQFLWRATVWSHFSTDNKWYVFVKKHNFHFKVPKRQKKKKKKSPDWRKNMVVCHFLFCSDRKSTDWWEGRGGEWERLEAKSWLVENLICCFRNKKKKNNNIYLYICIVVLWETTESCWGFWIPVVMATDQRRPPADSDFISRDILEGWTAFVRHYSKRLYEVSEKENHKNKKLYIRENIFSKIKMSSLETFSSEFHTTRGEFELPVVTSCLKSWKRESTSLNESERVSWASDQTNEVTTQSDLYTLQIVLNVLGPVLNSISWLRIEQ